MAGPEPATRPPPDALTVDALKDAALRPWTPGGDSPRAAKASPRGLVAPHTAPSPGAPLPPYPPLGAPPVPPPAGRP